MKYWFTIKQEIPQEDARLLWDKISIFGANLTILDDRAEIYGNSEDPYIISQVAKAIVDAGYKAERGR